MLCVVFVWFFFDCSFSLDFVSCGLVVVVDRLLLFIVYCGLIVMFSSLLCVVNYCIVVFVFVGVV